MAQSTAPSPTNASDVDSNRGSLVDYAWSYVSSWLRPSPSPDPTDHRLQSRHHNSNSQNIVRMPGDHQSPPPTDASDKEAAVLSKWRTVPNAEADGANEDKPIASRDDLVVPPIDLSRVEPKAIVVKAPTGYQHISSRPDSPVFAVGSPEQSQPSFILTQETMERLHGCLPGRFQAHDHYHLVYGTHRDGFSLQTLLRSSRPHARGPVLLVVRTTQGSRLGCFATEGWQAHLGHFGTGECFLFAAMDNENGFWVYPTQGANDYYLFCDGSFIAAGVSEGRFGLWLDAALTTGSTSAVATFNNPPLAHLEALHAVGSSAATTAECPFDIDAVELWSLKVQ
jgi:hypothetical protein